MAMVPILGVVVDFVELINQQLNINIRLHIEDQWEAVQEKAKKEKSMDLCLVEELQKEKLI